MSQKSTGTTFLTKFNDSGGNEIHPFKGLFCKYHGQSIYLFWKLHDPKKRHPDQGSNTSEFYHRGKDVPKCYELEVIVDTKVGGEKRFSRNSKVKERPCTVKKERYKNSIRPKIKTSKQMNIYNVYVVYSFLQIDNKEKQTRYRYNLIFDRYSWIRCVTTSVGDGRSVYK